VRLQVLDLPAKFTEINLNHPMEKIVKAGRIFYGAAMAGVGIHQLFYADYCPFIFPQWPNPIPGYAVLASIVNAALIVAGTAIIFEKRARTVSLILGGVLLLMILLGQIPYEYLVIPYKKTHLALWTLPLKELALAGGAFAIAGSLPDEQDRSTLLRLLEKLIPLSGVFFSTTMVCFGISHFLYTKTVADMVPSWLPAHYFWTYFAAAALIAGGIAITLRIWLKPVAILMGVMILIWFILLHVPDAITNPLLGRGNEITAAFSALAFSGTAFVIAGGYKKKIN
jgi:hypothetical protein